MSSSTAPISSDLLWPNGQYELLDFGHGRKLEAFAGRVLDRPCPAADTVAPRHPQLWHTADLRIAPSPVRTAGISASGPWPHWRIAVSDQVQMQLRVTSFGHVGLFPEQHANWRRIDHLVRHFPEGGARVLNLFAYTGAATLIAAAAGAQEVVHVDASRPTVRWARENADASGLAHTPIRWIVDDVRKFVAREIRRERRYDLIVLDPPTFGHGSSGKRWEIVRDLWPLLADCTRLLTCRAESRLVFSAHCEEPTVEEIGTWLARSCGPIEASGRMVLGDRQGRTLDAGFFAIARRR
ncbi:MAG: SAM-dependent methyltransferase [Pirellulaceae bacterium]|nr:MAG: SAM-dependent methyltransferase [Pirellulaceae bacterium]